MHYFARYPESLGVHKTKCLGEAPLLHEGVRIVDSHVGAWTELGPESTLLESTFGDFSYAAGPMSIVYADVGKFCSIASQVRINPGNHPMQRVTQHHFTYRRAQYGFGEDDKEFFNWRREHRCQIGHDVWLGHGSIVMPGVKIGTGAVVGAGAVVTKDVEPYTIVVGVPAKVMRLRFPEATVQKLMQIAWWEWDHDTIRERFDSLLDMDTFLEEYA